MFTYSSVDWTFCRPAYIRITSVEQLCCCMSFYFARATNTKQKRCFLMCFLWFSPFLLISAVHPIPSPPCLSQLLRKLKLQQHLQYKEQLYCFDPQVSGFCLHWGHQSQLSKQHQPPAFWRTAHKCVFLRFSLHGQRTNRHHTSALSNMLFRHQLQKIRVLK